MERILREDYQIITGADGESAWKRLKSGTSFDAVLPDLGLPYTVGMVLLQRIKADPVLRWVPVIILTRRNDLRTIGETSAAGARYHLGKPLQAAASSLPDGGASLRHHGAA